MGLSPARTLSVQVPGSIIEASGYVWHHCGWLNLSQLTDRSLCLCESHQRIAGDQNGKANLSESGHGEGIEPARYDHPWGGVCYLLRSGMSKDLMGLTVRVASNVLEFFSTSHLPA